MNRRKFLLTSTATVVGAGLVAGSRSSTTTEAKRRVKVAVEDDQDGFLGIVPEVSFDEDYSFTCDGTFEIELQNQTTEQDLRIIVDPTIEGSGLSLQDPSAQTVQLGIGEAESVRFSVGCPPGTDDATGTLEFAFTAGDKSQTTIKADRAVGVSGSCPPRDTDDSESNSSS